jgi:hypothetical protein
MYFDCGGERVFGKPDEGNVSPDTGEWDPYHQAYVADGEVLQMFSMTKFITSVSASFIPTGPALTPDRMLAAGRPRSGENGRHRDNREAPT